MIVPVSDPRDPRLAPFAELTDMQLRMVREPRWGVFVAEGPLAIERALTNGWQPISFLTSRDAPIRSGEQVPVFVGTPQLLREITGFHVHRGALGLFARRASSTVAEVLDSARRILVLEDLVDHANVGAAFRSAAALGADCAVVSPRCADPLYRRAVKVSMGASLSLPFTRAAKWPAALDEMQDLGVVLWALTPDASATDLSDMVPPARLALLVGTEGAGLTADALDRCDVRVRIPMAGGVDSLNVAAAAAVAMYAVRPRALQ